MLENYTNLKAVIISKLTALTIGGVTVFKGVYTTNETKPVGYPCACVIETVGEGIQLDTARNERVLQFKIKLAQELGIKTPAQASTIRLTITDKVMKMFDEDPQLVDSGADSVVRVNIAPIDFDEITKDRPIFESTFLINCTIIVNSY